MAIENTFIMLKPDTIKRGLVGEIISRIERKGYKIVEAKTAHLSKSFLDEHYAHLIDKPFYPTVVKHMTSGLVVGLIIQGENAIIGMRTLAGPTKAEEALPGTIRGDFALKTEDNIIHCSDLKENAKIEIQRFFYSSLNGSV
jgi:nucleoside-diphosphate kinase